MDEKIITAESSNGLEIKHEQEEEEVEYFMEITPNDIEEDVLSGMEPVSYLWTTEATTCLIEQYKKYRAMVGQTTRIRSLREMFEIVSREMRKHNFFFSSQKCENKWRVLERKYKQLVFREKLNKPGRIKDFYNWKHKSAMDEIFRNNLQQSIFDPKLLEPTNSSSQSAPDPKPSNIEATKSMIDLGPGEGEGDLIGEDCLAAILKSGFESIKKQMDVAEANKEKRHREKMAIKRSILDVQKKLLHLKTKKVAVEKSKLMAAVKQVELSELKFCD